MSKKIMIALILTFSFGNLFSQTINEKCKKSISTYCKKTLDLYQPLEFGELKSTTHTIKTTIITRLSDNHYRDSLIKIKNNYDTLFNIVSNIEKKISDYESERFVMCPDFWNSVVKHQLPKNDLVVQAFLSFGGLFFVNHYPYGQYSEEGKIKFFKPNQITDTIFLKETVYLNSMKFLNDGQKTYKTKSSSVYCVKHIYKVLNLDRKMVLIKSYFFIDPKTFEVIYQSGVDEYYEEKEEIVYE